METAEILSGLTFFNMTDLPLISSSNDMSECVAVKNSGRVLIFSVDKDTRFLLKTLLQIWNYQTIEFDYPENLPSIIKNENPDLILLDSFRPFDANFEIIRQIRTNAFCQAIPVIVLSGFANPNVRDLSMAIGANGFFVKPVDFDLLKSCLQENIEKFNKEKY